VAPEQLLVFAYVVTPTQKDCVGRKTRVIGKIQSNVLGNGFVGYSDIHIIESVYFSLDWSFDRKSLLIKLGPYQPTTIPSTPRTTFCFFDKRR
jgi:hypothetical protein